MQDVDCMQEYYLLALAEPRHDFGAPQTHTAGDRDGAAAEKLRPVHKGGLLGFKNLVWFQAPICHVGYHASSAACMLSVLSSAMSAALHVCSLLSVQSGMPCYETMCSFRLLQAVLHFDA